MDGLALRLSRMDLARAIPSFFKFSLCRSWVTTMDLICANMYDAHSSNDAVLLLIRSARSNIASINAVFDEIEALLFGAVLTCSLGMRTLAAKLVGSPRNQLRYLRGFLVKLDSDIDALPWVDGQAHLERVRAGVEAVRPCSQQISTAVNRMEQEILGVGAESVGVPCFRIRNNPLIQSEDELLLHEIQPRIQNMNI